MKTNKQGFIEAKVLITLKHIQLFSFLFLIKSRCWRIHVINVCTNGFRSLNIIENFLLHDTPVKLFQVIEKALVTSYIPRILLKQEMFTQEP